MITLILVLTALVVLTSWDAAAAEENVQPVPVRSDEGDAANR